MPMLRFTELPFAQQQTLYHEAAQRVLALHGLTHASITPITFVNNATFHVAAGEQQYALRVYRPHQSSGSAIRSELRWLQALASESAVSVPRLILAPNGEVLVRLKTAASSDALYGVLFAWLDGATRIPAEHTPDLAGQIGTTIGHVHQHSRHFSASGDHPRRKLTADQFIFWRLIEQHTPTLFLPEHRPVFAAIENRIQAVFSQFAIMDYGLIHADIIWKNILVQGKTIHLIDFESCGWGYYAYDLAPLLLNYWAEAHDPALRTALLAGYRRVQPLHLSDAAIDVLIAARHVVSCFWIALHLDNPEFRAQAPAIVAGRLQDIQILLNL